MICFAWSGFPQYAARCVGDLVKTTDKKVVVVATAPTVPIKGMEEVCGCEVVWVDGTSLANATLPFEISEIELLVVSGWATPAFNELTSSVRRHGGRVVAMVDNNFRFSFKELLRSLRFRLLLRKNYDGFLVPGKSGRRLLRFYGVADSLIKEGMYSADARLFFDGLPLPCRAKKIIFVGQLCERKNVLRMVDAFLKANVDNSWVLELYGCGPLKDKIPSAESVVVNDFLQPKLLAVRYREARAFCLASLEEHWGLVVHEAALSGCVLLLAEGVGAKDDLLQKNGYAFDPKDIDAVAEAFRKMMDMNDGELLLAQSESLRLAAEINVQGFADSVKEFVK